jgi:hypothetical protein
MVAVPASEREFGTNVVVFIAIAELNSLGPMGTFSREGGTPSAVSRDVKVWGLVFLVSCPEPRHVGSNSERHTVEDVETAALKIGRDIV